MSGRFFKTDLSDNVNRVDRQIGLINRHDVSADKFLSTCTSARQYLSKHAVIHLSTCWPTFFYRASACNAFRARYCSNSSNSVHLTVRLSNAAIMCKWMVIPPNVFDILVVASVVFVSPPLLHRSSRNPLSKGRKNAGLKKFAIVAVYLRNGTS